MLATLKRFNQFQRIFPDELHKKLHNVKDHSYGRYNRLCLKSSFSKYNSNVESVNAIAAERNPWNNKREFLC